GLLPVRPTGSKSNKETTSTPAGTSPAPAPTPQATDSAKAAQGASAVFSDDVKAQLSMVFSRLVKPAVLQLELDGTPLSKELRGFISEVVAISGGKLSSVVSDDVASVDDEGKASFDPAGVLPVARPCVRICTTDADGSLQPTGLAFHGVPSGHEFNSFVLGIYNAAGPGQPLEDDVKERIAELSKPVDVMLLVSLTCTMCPETVLSSQRIAAANPKVRAEAYDVSHFPELKEQYGVMSVPCIVINRDDGSQTVEFGKKSVPQMLDLIGA
ncbi:MAG: thioredoxin family protein, partial [Bifidobacterium crudilactis]|nr:thioredoxin family protein [Bifidobacterium crudilactis]